MDTPTLRGLNVAEFFALDLEGGSMTDAFRGSGVAYSTIHRAKSGGFIGRRSAKSLAAWSRTVPSAQAAGVCIDAARTLGLVADVDPDEATGVRAVEPEPPADDEERDAAVVASTVVAA